MTLFPTQARARPSARGRLGLLRGESRAHGDRRLAGGLGLEARLAGGLEGLEDLDLGPRRSRAVLVVDVATAAKPASDADAVRAMKAVVLFMRAVFLAR